MKHRVNGSTAWLVCALIGAMVVLHQDFWFWTDKRLVFGFLPVGLAYHAAYSLLAVGLMATLVRLAWPANLEDVKPLDGAAPRDPAEGGHA